MEKRDNILVYSLYCIQSLLLLYSLDKMMPDNDICIPSMTVTLATVKSNSTGTTFELKFVCFFRFFICYYIETNKNIPL